MPTRTLISKRERIALEFKTAKDRVSLFLCTNAKGDCMTKPMMLYSALNPRVLKGKNKNALPVFWRANKKVWVTAVILMDWFQNRFAPQVEKYLAEKEPLLQGPKDLKVAHPNVEVIFFPLNTKSLIQPLNE